MKQENVDINIGSKLDAKGFKQAETALNKLNKTVKNAAGAIGIAYGARAITQFGIASVKAFAEDDKAARVLGKTLDNLGLGFGNNAEAVNNYISKLEQQTGVLDDELRPAMDRLLRATGDITKSQELLSLALNISAGTGKTMTQVSQSLQKAYLGQTQALGRLGVGLSKAELTSSSFEQIQARLSELFAGQATEAANTYAGAINKLTVATNNAKETIGKGLVDALSILGGGGEGGLDNVINKINAASNAMASFARGTATAFKVLDTILNLQFTRIPGIFAKPASKATITPAIAAELKKAAAEKAQIKRSKEQSALLAKNTKAIKEQTALQKAGTLFDVEQTAIVAALKGKISEDERKRLELQLALLTGNTAEASKLAGELGKAQGLSAGLIAYLKDLPDADNPFKGWKTYLDAIEAQVLKIAKAGTGGSSGTVASNFANIGLGDMSDFIPANPGQSAFSPGSAAGAPVSVVVMLDGQELAGAITKVQTNNSLSGRQIEISRRTGTFATP
jgi:hypothetical protein